jgi:hypothetical protein
MTFITENEGHIKESNWKKIGLALKRFLVVTKDAYILIVFLLNSYGSSFMSASISCLSDS